jgi:acetyl/propionyl-CoA carboxylase alpha subunit
LSEYRITGIKTTLPFFQWLFDQPDFIEGRFHTAYLDEVLRGRNGQPFSDTNLPDAVQDVAAVAVAIQTVLAPTSIGGPGTTVATPNGRHVAPNRWRAQARAEAVGLTAGRER